MYPKLRAVLLAASLATALTLLGGTASAAPINVAPQVTGGFNQICLISQMGVLTCMGDNVNGQLGPKNSGGTIETPTVITDSAPVISAGLGLNHMCATLTSGAVRCRSQNYNGQLGTAQGITTSTSHPEGMIAALPAPATQVDANQVFSCAIVVGGAVYCWGTNNEGQLGVPTNGGTTNPNPTPMQVALPAAASQITLAYFHACALLVNGQKYCWGQNFYGQLGTATNTGTFNRTAPANADLVGASPSSIASFGNSTCFVSAARNADCVGSNQYGQLSGVVNNGSGNPNPNPSTAPLGGAPVVQIAAMADSTCALTASGEIWCYGNNYNGELGNVTDMLADVAHPNPAKVAGLPAPAIAIGNGYNTICAVVSTGAVYCWGNNGSGQLAQPAPSRVGTPTLVAGVNLLDAPPPITLSQGKLKFKFKKVRGKIRADATIPFKGSSALGAANCTGKIATSFYTSKKVKKKLKTKRYAKKSFKLGFVKNSCRAKVSLKISSSTAGKKLKFSVSYAGATYVGAADVAPYSKIKTVKVPKKLRKR